MPGFKDKTADMLERHLPKVQALVCAQLGPRARELAADEARLERCFAGAYELLPGPVRLVLKKERFVALCLENRHRILPA